MLDLESIKRMNAEAEERALQEQKRPIGVFYGGNVDEQKVRNIPNIGDLRPHGFKLVETYFVDSSGFGQENEPALTFGEFLRRVKPDRYYAIIEAGEFQVYIGEFKHV